MPPLLQVGGEEGETDGGLEGSDIEVPTLDPVYVVVKAVAEFLAVVKGRVDEQNFHVPVLRHFLGADYLAVRPGLEVHLFARQIQGSAFTLRTL